MARCGSFGDGPNLPIMLPDGSIRKGMTSAFGALESPATMAHLSLPKSGGPVKYFPSDVDRFRPQFDGKPPTRRVARTWSPVPFISGDVLAQWKERRFHGPYRKMRVTRGRSHSTSSHSAVLRWRCFRASFGTCRDRKTGTAVRWGQGQVASAVNPGCATPRTMSLSRQSRKFRF
jgi:hypothetical protein